MYEASLDPFALLPIPGNLAVSGTQGRIYMQRQFTSADVGSPCVTSYKLGSGSLLLRDIAGWTKAAERTYVQLFDSNSDAVPANTTKPNVIIPVPGTPDDPGAEITFSLGLPWNFTKGCWVAISTTRDTLTLGTADLYFMCDLVISV